MPEVDNHLRRKAVGHFSVVGLHLGSTDQPSLFHKNLNQQDLGATSTTPKKKARSFHCSRMCCRMVAAHSYVWQHPFSTQTVLVRSVKKVFEQKNVKKPKQKKTWWDMTFTDLHQPVVSCTSLRSVVGNTDFQWVLICRPFLIDWRKERSERSQRSVGLFGSVQLRKRSVRYKTLLSMALKEWWQNKPFSDKGA